MNQYSRTASAISSLPSPKIVFQAATNLSVKNEPDSQIFLSDHLSRAVRDETSGTEEEIEVFFLKLESQDPMQTVKVTPERLGQQRSGANQDPGVIFLP